MKKVLIAFNSFKGVMSATELCSRTAELLKGEAETISFPISDGGDGFLELLENTFELQRKVYTIKSFYSDEFIEVPILIDVSGKTIYIESAYAVGLRNIPSELRNPKSYNSNNLGELIKAVIEEEKPVKIVIGIGGTAVMDMGLGLCEAFGLRGVDRTGAQQRFIPSNFGSITDIIWEHDTFRTAVECIVDVDNPLLGNKGGLRVYGAQKGASKAEIRGIEAGVENILSILRRKGIIEDNKPLSGAGGGLAAGLEIFLEAKVISSESFLMNNKLLREYIEEADYLITGEGSFDNQSLYKKGASVLINMVKGKGKQVFLCCGIIEKQVFGFLPDYVKPIELRRYFGSVDESIEKTGEGIKAAALEIIKELKC